MTATEQQHHAGENEAEQREWHKDDDRHLQRFADAVARFVDLSPEAQVPPLPRRGGEVHARAAVRMGGAAGGRRG